jgi:hypothetical protein
VYLIGSGLVDAAFSYGLFTTLNTTVFLSVSCWIVCVLRDFPLAEAPRHSVALKYRCRPLGEDQGEHPVA